MTRRKRLIFPPQTHPIGLAVLALGLGACTTSITFVDRDGGLASSDEGVAADDAGQPADPALAAAVSRWTAGQDAWIRHICECTGNPGCERTYQGPVDIPEFSACAASFLSGQPAAESELVDLVACYADELAGVESCIATSGCPPERTWEICRDDFRCTYQRCETGSSSAIEAMLDACTTRSEVGTPGEPRGLFCRR